jgi:hypothetical protein
LFPKPAPGQVISYAYLWQTEHQRGQEEGLKDRPCAVILVITNEDGSEIVTVLPITHAPPSNPDLAVEIPSATKRRLELDDERSWVVLTEANRFAWPGPDLRPTRRGEAASVLYGELPGNLLTKIRDGFLAVHKKHKIIVPRSK